MEIKVKGAKRTGTNLVRYIINNFTAHEAVGNDEYGPKHGIKTCPIRMIATIKKPDDRIASMRFYLNEWKDKNIDFSKKEVVEKYLKRYSRKYGAWLEQGAQIIKIEDIIDNPDRALNFLDPDSIELPDKRIMPSSQKLNFSKEDYEKRDKDLDEEIQEKIEGSKAMSFYRFIV